MRLLMIVLAIQGPTLCDAVPSNKLRELKAGGNLAADNVNETDKTLPEDKQVRQADPTTSTTDDAIPSRRTRSASSRPQQAIPR